MGFFARCRWCKCRLGDKATAMGAYKYVEELWKKKQSDVMRFLLRVHCWECRQVAPLALTRLAASATRPSRDTLSTVCACAAVAGSARFPRVLFTVSPCTRVSPSLRLLATLRTSQRSALAGPAAISVSSTLTG